MTNPNGAFANKPFKIETINTPIKYHWGGKKVLNSNFQQSKTKTNKVYRNRKETKIKLY